MPSGFGGLSTPQASLLSPYPAPKWADFVQMGNWQELGIVDQERAAGLTEKDIISWVLNCREESASARKVLEPYWIYYEALYNLRTWDDDKQEWQSQIVVPEIRTKVRVILSMIQSGLLDAPEFFKTVNLGTPYDDEVVRFIQRLLDHHVQDSGFIDAMLGALEEGLLLGSGCAGLTIEDFVRCAAARWRRHTSPSDVASPPPATRLRRSRHGRRLGTFRRPARPFDAQLGVAGHPDFPEGWVAQQLSPFGRRMWGRDA